MTLTMSIIIELFVFPLDKISLDNSGLIFDFIDTLSRVCSFFVIVTIPFPSLNMSSIFTFRCATALCEISSFINCRISVYFLNTSGQCTSADDGIEIMYRIKRWSLSFCRFTSKNDLPK